jgi:peroxiredoxin-like protein
MHALPHQYRVTLRATATGPTEITAAGLPSLEVAPPAAFDGPGDRWSPEDLLMASVASCFLFTLRAIAGASKVEFTSVACETEGILDRVEGGLAFREIIVRATVTAPAGTNRDRLERLVRKAEEGCLITRSLRSPVRLEAEVRLSG